ncbi:MAG TPA: dioxygenase [Pseudomonas xinjiangensis]|uniref:Dioxygenase n=2 Tax=root TaxID=1 RepID=A0A7V1FT49_9GAMM|nr:dioxygenase [Halopseudomonas xinjiangensis]HEC47207.1 dioxygenase [Halopseudomonas xinjiangensis]
MTDTSAATTGRTPMPVLFVPHGAGPCFFMDWNPVNTWNRLASFLKGVADTLPARPNAIVLVSGHWLESSFSVTGGTNPGLIYDYHGFPPHTYELAYPAQGSPGLAERITHLLKQAGIDSQMDTERGFDHGMFIPLKLMFPGADIPVVQLSLHQNLNPRVHLEAGKALASLREEGVLIIGSGMSFHNMRGFGDARFGQPSDAFDSWLTTAVESESAQRDALLEHWEQAPHARDCHPHGGEEHLLPLLVAAGAGGLSAGRRVYSERVMETTQSAFRFG